MEGQAMSVTGLDELIGQEWLVTNGIGGYACSTSPGLNTRKYHGLLVASMAPPVRRMVLLSRVEETVTSRGNTWPLASNEYPGIIYPRGYEFLRAFRHDPFPRWAYQGDGWTIEKSLRLIRGENTVCLSYSLLGSQHPVELDLRPMLALRPIHDLMYQWNGRLTVEKRGGRQYRVAPTSRTPEVFFAHDGASNGGGVWYLNTIYRRESERGYSGLEDVWSPGAIKWTLYPGDTANFICSADPIEFDAAIKCAQSQCEAIAIEEAMLDTALPVVALRRAAKQFIDDVPDDVAMTRGSAVAAYPWSSPSLRESLVGFTGLYLVTEKFAQGLRLLRCAAATLRDGLIASRFPEDGTGPIYHGADVSLWFVNAVYDYLRYTKDDAGVAQHLLEPVMKIIDAYDKGTRLGISTGADHLLQTHVAGLPTTWMDAKAVDWVVTPRQGKPVELNALWYNALCITADLCERSGHTEHVLALRDRAVKVKEAFNRIFWSNERKCCYDVIESAGHDPAIRPNQLLSISLPFAVLNGDRHEGVLQVIEAELLTPQGLRTLSPHDVAYQARYAGNVITRDRAQHNGTAYPWLLGAFVSALMRTRGRTDATRAHAARVLQPSVEYLNGVGMGHLPELFDGDLPQHAGGAIASALNVAEILRAYVEDVQGTRPVVDGRAIVVTTMTGKPSATAPLN